MNPRSSTRKPAPLRTRLRAAATDAILDAAEAVASERGIEEASCAAIAKRAGVAVGTLYNYFPDREGLLTALFKARRGDMIPRITDAAKAAAHHPFERRLRFFVRDVMAAYEEHRRFIRIALDADRHMPNVKDARNTVMVTMTTALEQIFADAAQMGFFPEGEGREAVYARILQGALKALTIWHIEKGTPLTDDLDVVLDAILHGVDKS